MKRLAVILTLSLALTSIPVFAGKSKNPDHGMDLPKRAAHTHPLNGALKGRAFWVMMAHLAGGES